MRAIELFPCSGGMAEGFRRVGVTFDLAFDKDPDACESYARNLGHRPVQLDVRDLLRMVQAGAKLGPLDLLVADPPCTPWSRAGKREGLDDDRDMLRQTVDLIALLRPAAYLIGNVPGLQDATQWPIVQQVLGGLARAGYCVADYVQLDAADYGVPQHRIRPFWYGHLEGPCVRWPAPTHGDPKDLHPTLPGIAPLLPWVTCRQALSHLPAAELGHRRVEVHEGEHRPRRGPPHPPRTQGPQTKESTMKKKPAKFWTPGDNYWIRTVTHILTGKLVSLDEHEVLLVDAAWIAETGRYADTLKDGTLGEVEPYPDGQLVAVGRGSIVDATRWMHALPRTQK